MKVYPKDIIWNWGRVLHTKMITDDSVWSITAPNWKVVKCSSNGKELNFERPELVSHCFAAVQTDQNMVNATNTVNEWINE